MINLSQKLHTLLLYLFYALFLVTPLIWLPTASELFEFPKMLFVYAITILIMATWIARMILAKKLLIRKTPIDVPLLLFLFSQILATVLSIHPHTSLFGYYSRFNGGLLSTLSYYLLFYAFVSNLTTKQALKVVTTAVASATVASLYAVPEHFGRSFSCLSISPHQFNAACWVQDVQTRIFGTFGQPNWLSAYLVTILPITWALTLSATKKSRLALLLSTNTLLFTTLIFTRSRSGLFALAAAFSLFWILTFIKTRGAKLPKFALICLTIFIPALIFGTSYSPSITQLFSPVSTNPAATSPPTGTILDSGDLQIPAITGGGTESGKIREIVWTGAINMTKAYPLFGTGVETFAYSYYNFRPLQHNLVSEWDFLYNKAHNELLNLSATTGLFGLLSYLALILFFAFLSLKFIFTTNSKQSKLTPSSWLLATSFLAGYLALLVTNFFGFSTGAVCLLFFLFPAIFLSITSDIFPTQPLLQKTITKLSKLQYLGLTLLLLTTGYLLLTTGKFLLADNYYAAAKKNESEGALTLSLENYQRAIALFPREATFHNDYSNALSKLALVYASDQDHPKTVELAQRSFEESATTLRQNPVNLNFYKAQAGVYIRLSVLDPSLLEVAKTILEDAQTLAPTDAKITYNLGLIHLDLGNTDTAISYFQQAIDQKPNHEGARIELAALYQQAGQTDQAIQQYQFILNYIAPGNSVAQQALEELTTN